jgi:hypothetical protein
LLNRACPKNLKFEKDGSRTSGIRQGICVGSKKQCDIFITACFKQTPTDEGKNGEDF